MVIPAAGEHDLREKRLFSPKNGNSLSCEQAGIKALFLSTHTQIQRTTGSLLTAALQETGHPASIPKRLSEETSILGAGVLHVREDSSATSLSQVKGARDELENRGAVLLPGIGLAHCSPSQTSLSSKRLPMKDAPVPQDATPSTNQA